MVNSIKGSGGYWVRRMRQLPRPPLENTAYSFIVLCMFFRDHYEVGTKSGKSIRSEDFFLEISMILVEKKEIRDKSPFFLENTNFWEFLPRAPNFEYPPLIKGF